MRVLPLVLGGTVALYALPVKALPRRFNFVPQPRGYNVPIQAGFHGNPLSRAGFGYIHSLGGPINSQGYFQTPVDTQQAFGARLNDGLWEFPAEWSDQPMSILYSIQGGRIFHQDYRLQPLGGGR